MPLKVPNLFSLHVSMTKQDTKLFIAAKEHLVTR